MKPILKLRFPARSLFKKPLSEASMIRRLSLVSIVGNTLLSAFKLYAGLAGSSGAMISDAVHSMSDVASTVVAACGVRMSRKEADRKHPYGHDRMECVAAVILGSILFATGLGIGKTGLSHILFWSWAPRSAPDAIACIIAAAKWRQGLCTFPKKSHEQRPLSRLPAPTRTTRRGSASTT